MDDISLPDPSQGLSKPETLEAPPGINAGGAGVGGMEIGGFIARDDAKMAMIGVTVIHADGSRTEYGTVSYWHKNPIKMLWWRLKQKIKSL